METHERIENAQYLRCYAAIQQTRLAEIRDQKELLYSPSYLPPSHFHHDRVTRDEYFDEVA